MKNSIIQSLALFLLFCFGEIRTDCNGPLGMENGDIGNNQITASHWLYYKSVINIHYAPYLARLNINSTSGGWCSEEIYTVKNQYIEIDLLQNKRLTGIATQGRYGSTEYVEGFKISYQRDYETAFRNFHDEQRNWKVFKANRDSITIKKIKFMRPIIARRIRIYPTGNEFAISCMRLELYGCKWSQSEAGLLSYTSPVGSKYSGIDMRDTSFDGTINKSSNQYSKGVGKLTDDIYGTEKLSTDNVSPWIAYDVSKPIITFLFVKERVFKQVIVHVNKINKAENIFEKVEILKSMDGINFTHIKYHIPSSKEYFQREGPFAVVVNVGQILAKSIRVVFSKNSKWLLISEVTFLSENDFDKAFSTSKPVTRFVKPTEPDIDFYSTRKDGRNTGDDGNQEQDDDSKVKRLSFPIILTITLVTIIAAVLVVIFILKTYKKKQKSKNKNYKHDVKNQKPIPVDNNTIKFMPVSHSPSMNKQQTNSIIYDENTRLAFQLQQQKHLQNNGCVNAPLLKEGLYVYPVMQQQVYNDGNLYEYVPR